MVDLTKKPDKKLSWWQTARKPIEAQEMFTLAEGSVTITYPSELSGESLKDLKDYLDIFLRKAQRLSDDPHDPVPVEMGHLR